MKTAGILRAAPLAALILTAIATAYSQRTTRPNLHAEHTTAISHDSIARYTSGDSLHLSIRGYDKPLRSSSETFFVVNSDSVTVSSLYLTFTYYAQSGAMLHRIGRRVDVDLPAGETRQLRVRSWDVQNNFYYHLSTPPARTNAPSYTVTIRIDTIWGQL